MPGPAKSITVAIQGMREEACARRVEAALSHVPGVWRVTVDFASGTATLEVQPGKVDVGALASAVDDAGYTLQRNEATVLVSLSGADSQQDEDKARASIEAVPGFLQLDGDADAETLRIVYDTDEAEPSDFLAALRQAGFSGAVADAERGTPTEPPSRELAVARARFWVSWSFTLLALGWIVGLATSASETGLTHWIELVLVFPVFVVNATVFVRVWMASWAWKHDLAISFFFCVTAGLGSLLLALNGWDVPSYGTAAALALAMYASADYLDARSRSGQSRVVGRLRESVPTEARVVVGTDVRTVPITEINPGDTVSADAETVVPVDGVIVQGSGTLENPSVMGSTSPIQCGPGEKVLAGARVKDGSIQIKALRVSSETLFGRLVSHHRKIQHDPSPFEDVAPRLSKTIQYLVPWIAVIAAALWLLQADWMDSASDILASTIFYAFRTSEGLFRAYVALFGVFVVGYPCAMVLAVRLPWRRALADALSEGIAYRDSDTFKQLGSVRCVCVNMPVLTEEEPAVVAVAGAEGSQSAVLGLAASIGREMDNGPALAIVKAAKAEGLPLEPVEHFDTHSGKGASGVIDTRTVLVGQEAWLREMGVDTSAFGFTLREYEALGYLITMVAVEGEAVGAVALEWPLQANARNFVDGLRRRGIEVVLLSEQSERAAEAFAQGAGVHRVVGNVSGDAMPRIIDELKVEFGESALVDKRSQGRSRLQTADAIKVMLGASANNFRDTTDVAILSGDIERLLTAMVLPRRTMSSTRRAVFWALVFNGLALPLAVFALLHPIVAAAAFGLGAIGVAGSSLRLRSRTLG